MAYGRIPEQFIDDVLLRTDIVELIDARVKLKKAGKNYQACCPFHNEKTPSFTVSRDKQFYHCFGCGASGNALGFVMEYEHKDFIIALTELATRAGLEMPDTRDPNSAPKESSKPLLDALEKAAVYFEQQLKQHPDKQKAVQYLQNRGLTGSIAKHYRLGYAPAGWDNLVSALGSLTDDKKYLLQSGLLVQNEQSQRIYDAMRDRVIFPIRDFRGRVIGFGGRVLTNEKPKYLNSPESPVFHKGQELYGLYEAKQASNKLEQILVVEGYMDVVALAQFNITNAVATLGTATSTAHIERLFRLVPEIIFCFDGDNAGRKAAWRALEATLPALHDGKAAKFLFLPQDEDPDSLVRKEGQARFIDRINHESEALADFLIRHLSQNLNLKQLEDRSRLVVLSKPLLATMPDGLYREMLLQRLAQITELDNDLLRRNVLATAPLPAVVVTPEKTVSFEPLPQTNRYKNNRPWKKREYQARTQISSLSLVDRAVRLLLQNPKNALVASVPTLLAYGLDEDSLLIRLITYLQAHPDISITTLMTTWFDTDLGEALFEAAANEFLITHDEGIQREFNDILTSLHIAHLENNLQLCDPLDFAQITDLKREIQTLKKEMTPTKH